MMRLFLTVCVVAAITGCHSKTSDESNLHDGTTIYLGWDFSIVRIKINGVNYLVNSNGGIVVEQNQ